MPHVERFFAGDKWCVRFRPKDACVLELGYWERHDGLTNSWSIADLAKNRELFSQILSSCRGVIRGEFWQNRFQIFALNRFFRTMTPVANV